MPHTHYNLPLDSNQSHDVDQIEDIPESERFDWKTIRSLCVEGNAKHIAYGKTFEEYAANRNRYVDSDDTARKQLSFYLPLFPSMLTLDFATAMKTSSTRFLVMMTELGMINFQVDYHDQYQIVKMGRKNLVRSVLDEKTRITYMQLSKQVISLGSSNGARNGLSKHYAPNVPEWLYNAVTETAAYLNMTMSDFIYLCWCIGVSKTLTNDLMNPVIDKDIIEILMYFDIEIDIYSRRIRELLSANTTC